MFLKIFSPFEDVLATSLRKQKTIFLTCIYEHISAAIMEFFKKSFAQPTKIFAQSLVDFLDMI